MLENIHNKWMQLDPSEQYMYWIITFAVLLFTACIGLITALSFDFLTMTMFPYIAMGIFGFITLFSMVVGYLVFVWSKEYDKQKVKS